MRKLPLIVGIVAGIVALAFGLMLTEIATLMENLAPEWMDGYRPPIPVHTLVPGAGGYAFLALGVITLLATAVGLKRPRWTRFVLLREAAAVAILAALAGLLFAFSDRSGLRAAPYVAGPLLIPALVMLAAGLVTPRTMPAKRPAPVRPAPVAPIEPGSRPSPVTPTEVASRAEPEPTPVIPPESQPTAAFTPPPTVAPDAGTRRFCMECGAALRPGSRFCAQCGTTTDTAAPSATT